MQAARTAVTLVVAITLCSAPVMAQDTTDATIRRQQRTLDSLAARLIALQARVDSLGVAAPAVTPGQQSPARGTYMNVGFVALVDAGSSSEKDVPTLLLGDHDPKSRGFTIPNTELTLDGAVDPYFKGFSNIVFKLDDQGETGVELEEAYVLTTSLPANLQIKAGQFFAEFGRHNPQHPHSWAFIDQPLVISTMFGPEGLRSPGARLSWLVPTPWYTEAMAEVANSNNATTFSFRSDESSEIHGGVLTDRPVLGFRDMMLVPRLVTSLDLTETQTLVLGTSAAFGPNNAGPSTETQVYGVDGYWKWKSATANQGFPFVSMQAEGMLRRYETDQRLAIDAPLTTLPAEVLDDRGGYAQVLWGIKPRIVAGLRGEVVRADGAAIVTLFHADRARVSPNLTWYPTEFSKLRLQYNYDDRKGIGSDHSVWMQFEFLLGAHAAHKF